MTTTTETKYRSIEAELYGRWFSMCERLHPTAEVKALDHGGCTGWFNVVIALYKQEHRSYHNLRHVLDLLDRLAESDHHGSPMTGPREDVGHALDVMVAIWFHDAIYVVGSKDNERRSANLASAFLTSMGSYEFDERFCDSVYEAIMATKHNGEYLGNASARLMVDLDLAGFADPWEKFEINNERVRAEYAGVPAEKYRRGRLAFLGGLLARDRIFYTLRDLEQPARANIERHMVDLLKS